jgi:hypothetical protein
VRGAHCLARRAHVLAQEKGVAARLRSVAVTDARRTGATPLANGFVIDLGDVDGGEVARTPPPGQVAGSAAVGGDPVPGFVRQQ